MVPSKCSKKSSHNSLLSKFNCSKWSTMEIPLIGESILFVFLVGIFLCFCVSACACHCVCLSVWLDMWLCAACNLLQFQTRPVKCIFLIKQCDTPPPVSFARSGSHHSNTKPLGWKRISWKRRINRSHVCWKYPNFENLLIILSIFSSAAIF